MDPFDFMMNVLDPVDLSRWPTRSQALLMDVGENTKKFLDGKFKMDYALESGTYPAEVQRYTARLIRRTISDLDRKFNPRIQAMAPTGDPNDDMVARIVKGLFLDFTGNILMHLLYEEFYIQFYKKAEKIDYKNTKTVADDMFVKCLAGSFDQASLILRTNATKAGIEVHDI